ncbi:ribose-phosphate pyrophosphokinase [Striga asiatica]|uniref:Ribose-phosphate pyrophosphokinase n=1 Tax=Striga asiatica TaxID=4170 RepID=A0A5A7Q321_STRAF|nr:ribose-phosphate pyrophosphokinase [Striga asiatica]
MAANPPVASDYQTPSGSPRQDTGRLRSKTEPRQSHRHGCKTHPNRACPAKIRVGSVSMPDPTHTVTLIITASPKLDDNRKAKRATTLRKFQSLCLPPFRVGIFL